jgi:hypothetical protein
MADLFSIIRKIIDDFMGTTPLIPECQSSDLKRKESEWTVGNEVKRVYKWDLDSVRNRKLHGELSLTFSKNEMQALRDLNPFSTYGRDGKSYATNIRIMFRYLLDNPAQREKVRTVANYIRQRITRAKYSELDMVQFALDFVQAPNIVYRIDEECESIEHVKEYMRFPDEVLFDKEGDCDCKSSLMAAIFHELGYNVIIMLSQNLGHAAIGLECGKGWLNQIKPRKLHTVMRTYNNKRYLFCETTGDGFKIGEIRNTDSVKSFDTIIEIPV